MIYKRIKNINLRTKLLLSYLSVILLPVLLIGYFLISRTKVTVLEQTNYINQISFQQTKNNIVNQLNTFIKLSDDIVNEKMLVDYGIPKFILQPIVENAIYHAIEMKIGKG